MIPDRNTIRSSIAHWLTVAEDGPRLAAAGDPHRRSVVLLNKGTVLRCFGHLDIADLDALVIDPVLNVLGIVQIASAPEEGASRATAAEALIQQAGYLRFLAAELYGHARPAPAVELVLGRPKGEIADLRHQLGRINRETHLLHGIGLNLLDVESLGPRSLARAFCWLLPATRRLYESYAGEQGGVDVPVTLEIRTLRSMRDLTLTLSERVTVIRGQNGTGKSTIAEAVELALTGDSVRLRSLSAGSYADVMRALRPIDDPDADVGVTLRRGPISRRWSGEPLPVGQSRPATLAFRLDIQDMQRLSAVDPVRRLATLDEAFDLGADQERRFAQARDRLAEALGKNTHVIGHFFPERAAEGTGGELPGTDRVKLRRHISSLIHADGAGAHRILASLLLHPLRPEDLETLGIEIAPLPPDELAKHLDKVVKEFHERMEVARRYLPAAAEALRSVSDWHSRRDGNRRAAIRDRNATMGKLQRFVALHEVVSSLSSLAAAADAMLEAAEHQPDGHSAAEDDSEAHALEGLKGLAELDGRINFRLLANDIEADLLRYVERAAYVYPQDDNAPSGGDRRVRTLTRKGQEALDTLTPILAGSIDAPSAMEGFGTAIVRAMEPPYRRIAFGDVDIGSPGWANLPLQITDRVQHVLRSVEDGRTPGIEPSQRLADLAELSESLEDYGRKEMELSSSFMRKLDPFAEAVNEIVALMTTARWAYDPLRLTVNEQGTGLPIAIERSEGLGIGVEAILNTAELNVLTLALFLLLAPRMDNDARLLVLDDPWHAMDEQSAATASRALAQILRILPPEWRVLALVHGDFHAATLTQETSAEQRRLSWFDTKVSLDLERLPETVIPVADVLDRTVLLPPT